MSRIPCSRCAKRFRTARGLRWHVLHRHDYRDVEGLLSEPSLSTLIIVAAMRETQLEVLAKRLGSSVHDVQDMIKRHFPEYGNGPSP